MGAKGRKRKQLKKAKHRTGLIERLTGPFSTNQSIKRAIKEKELANQNEAVKNYLGIS